ncbi:hypothetical protein CBS101457_004628 [Exobasidium rhododendri]|nr:hypothetical protein CBS101457_004628 [Exobasidium rhododendri]
MELVNNTLGNISNLNRNTFGDPALSSEAVGHRNKSASDVSNAILEIFRCSLSEAESYLATFEAKLKLEEDYVKGLKMLSDRSKDSMVKLDARITASTFVEPSRAELPRARQAWKGLRENSLREIDARLYYIETMRQGVTLPLTVYRDAQERIRKRIKEDLKTSIGRYDEMRNHTLPRARKTYEKRCDEVEQMRLQQQAIEDQRTLLHPTHMSVSREPSYQGSSKDASSPVLSSSAFVDGVDDHGRQSFGDDEVLSPQRTRSVKHAPLHARRESRGNVSTLSDSDARVSSGSASIGPSPKLSGDTNLPAGEKKGHFLDALRSRENWDAARKEAPKKLNALFSRMREGGQGSTEKGSDANVMSTSPGSEGSSNAGAATTGNGLGVTLGGGPGSMKSNQNLAIKTFKAKRDSEEADQSYRKAVFDLETLRLRREKTISAAITSVIESRRELYLTCQAVWMQAERSSQVLTSAQSSMSTQAVQILSTSLETLEDELHLLETRVPSMSGVEEGRVPYVNYYFGECKDLIFGVSLIDYAFSRAQYSAPSLGPNKVEAPIIVRKCIRFIEERALKQSGIYRISAKHTAIHNLAHALEKDEERFEFDPAHDEPATVAGVLKLYLRQLPDAVMPIPWEERVKYTHERQDQISTGFAALKSRIRRLPSINQATLKLIVEHLAKVASHADENKMNVSNLSIVFGPLLLSQADHETTSIAAAMEEDRVTEDLILYAHDIFDLSHAGAPVLPPINSSSKADNTKVPMHVFVPATAILGAGNDGAEGLDKALATSHLAHDSNSDTVLPIHASSSGLSRSNAVTTSTSTEAEIAQHPQPQHSEEAHVITASSPIHSPPRQASPRYEEESQETVV